MKKILACIFLSVALVGLFTAHGLAAEDTGVLVSGNLKLMLEMSYPESASTIGRANIQVTVKSKNGAASTPIFLNRALSSKQVITLDGTRYDVNVTPLNALGVAITTERNIKYFSVEVSNLPLGEYAATFMGVGYARYTTGFAQIKDYSKQINLNTRNTRFAIGDINGDTRVDGADLALLENNLNTYNPTYDLNRDNKLDITDIAYINRNIRAFGTEQIIDTALITASATDLSVTATALGANAEGDVSRLFDPTNTLKINAANGQPIVIPIQFNTPTMMSRIAINSPTVSGAVEGGTALVEYIDANGANATKQIAFGNAIQGVSYIGETEGQNTVVIDLGMKVAVKKITITVTKVSGQNGTPSYTVVQNIEFLKDIVQDNTPVDTTPKNLVATASDAKVVLNWNTVPNVTGYKVRYGKTSGALDRELLVNTNTATISGLDNLVPYYFSVSAVNGSWEGGRSAEVTATPAPLTIPAAPDNLSLSPSATGISATWSVTKNATAYNLYLKADGESDYIKKASAITSSSYSITGLRENTGYSAYVTAQNTLGEGPRSLVATTKTQSSVITPPAIPTLNRIPNTEIAEITMTYPIGVNLDEYPDKRFDVNFVADGNYSTFWTARAFWENKEFNITFKTPQDMNYLVYVPRLDGKYKESLYKYNISVTDSRGSKKQIVNGGIVQNSPEKTGFAVLSFPRTTDIKKIHFEVMQWNGSPTNISLSEVAFYRYFSVDDDIKALFADNSYTSLSSKATQAEIDRIKAIVNNTSGYFVDKTILTDELNMAQSLLNGGKTGLGKIINGIKSRKMDNDIKPINNFEPLGVVGEAGKDIVIYAQMPAGETVNLVATQFFAEASAWESKPIPIANGRNVINIPQIGSTDTAHGGPLYIVYTGNRQSEIKLHVKYSTQIPVLELSEWASMTETQRRSVITEYVTMLSSYVNTVTGTKTTAFKNSTEISLPNILLSLPADQVLAGINAAGTTAAAKTSGVYDTALAWQDLLSVVYKTHGIDNPQNERGRFNIRYARMFAGAFMYASGRHVGIGYGSVSALMQGKPVSSTGKDKPNALFGWGIAHELGHVMDSLGKAEITNNIYSLFAQTYDGNQNTLMSRLEGDLYTEIFDKVSSGQKGLSNNVFVSLGMYWQLHLAYDGASDNFYNALNKAYKMGEGKDFSGDDRFAVVTSKLANVDLTDFFGRWGITLSDAAKTAIGAYPKENRYIWYLSDASRRARLSGKTSPNNVTASATATVNDKVVTLKITSNADSSIVQGYEIVRNGKPIAFVGKPEYIDDVGVINNLTLSYAINVIDILGNTIATASVPQVKIGYDAVINKSLWSSTYDAQASAVTITFNGKQSVAGIKISGTVPASGGFEVHAQTDAGLVKAAVVDFTKNDATNSGYLKYFTKPGAAATDTRIWTYDTSSIKLVGVDEAMLSRIDFVGYPGDNIEITKIGRLTKDYKYDNDVIKAGTVVIVGNYRGDPVYDTVTVSGRFETVDHTSGTATTTDRELNGYALMFAEIPSDGAVSAISDGIWIFVPDVQAEKALLESGDASACTDSAFPKAIKASLYTTDDANSAASKRLSSDTAWIAFPSDVSMPGLELSGGNQ